MPAPLSIIIPMSRTDAIGLGPTLGALSEGVFDGIVREVILAAPARDEKLSEIAEETGARLTVQAGPVAKRMHAAEQIALGDWTLSLSPGTILPPGWPLAARAHIQHSPGMRAAFRLSGYGGFRASMATRVFGAPALSQGVLSPASGPVARTVVLLRSSVTVV